MSQEIVLLSGGAGNIAQAVTKKYLENECVVIALDIQKENPKKEFYENSNYEYIQLDVTKTEKIKEVKEMIEKKYHKITHFISGAGIPMRSEFDGIENLKIEDIDQSIKLNLTSHIYLTKIFFDLLKKETNKNKTVTFVSSINALKNFDIPVYSAAKAGIYGFMYGIVKEFGSAEIRVNTISPGTVPTEDDIKNHADILENKKKFLALKEFAAPQDIADALFSITHGMKAITGQNIIVDGGQVL